MAIHRNQVPGVLLLALVLLTFSYVGALARSWTLSELDTLSSREWLWIDKWYKEPISEYYTETQRPDQLPERYRYITPTYPEEAAKAGLDGSVWLKILIDEKGKVRAARILEDSGLDVGFEAAALESAKKSTWKPAFKDGKRVPIWVTYEAVFSLLSTNEGVPIRILNHWDWGIREASSVFGEMPAGHEPEVSELPASSEFVAVDQAPVRKSEGQVIYPEPARKARRDGSVWVRVLVSRTGQVTRAAVAKESGQNCGFEEAALLSAINSKWLPARQGGAPINLWVTYEVRFVLRR